MHILKLSRLKLFIAIVIFTVGLLASVSIALANSRATVDVDIFNFGFTDANITIDVGDTVQWTNTEGFHNVSTTVGTAPAFRCGPGGCDQTGGDGAAGSTQWTTSFTFDTPGVYDYICQIHPSMQGTITVNAGLPDVYINEIRIDDVGADDNEYVELFGPADTSLDGLTYLVIGDGTGGSGVIEATVDLISQTIPASGYFVMAEDTFTLTTSTMTTSLNFENSDNVTHLLVAGFSGADGDDLDTDDDGTLDVMPWSAVIDAIGLVEATQPPDGGEYVYGAALGFSNLGPNGSFVPAHAYRFPDGGGRVPTGDWQIGEFDLGVTDTPGETNSTPTAVTLTQTNSSVRSLSLVLLGSVVGLAVISARQVRRRDA